MASLEYLAGYFDGEGCVTVSKGRTGRTPHLRICIQSADKEILDEFVTSLGGSVLPLKSKKPVKRALYTWCMGGRGAQEVLSKLLPFLISKKLVAELALKMNFYPTSGYKVTEKELANRWDIREQISAINQRITVH